MTTTALSVARRQWPAVFLLASILIGLWLQGQVANANQAANDARTAAKIARAQERALKASDVTNCESRNAARLEANAHIRAPLKAMFVYTATLERKASKDKTVPARYRRQAVAVAKRFDIFAAAIVPLNPLACGAGS